MSNKIFNEDLIIDLIYDIIYITNQSGGGKNNSKNKFLSFLKLKHHITNKLNISNNKANKILGIIIRDITKQNNNINIIEILKRARTEFDNNQKKYLF